MIPVGPFGQQGVPRVIFFGWVFLLISSAHLHVRPAGGASYVQTSGRNQIDPHPIERSKGCRGWDLRPATVVAAEARARDSRAKIHKATRAAPIALSSTGACAQGCARRGGRCRCRRVSGVGLPVACDVTPRRGRPATVHETINKKGRAAHRFNCCGRKVIFTYRPYPRPSTAYKRTTPQFDGGQFDFVRSPARIPQQGVRGGELTKSRKYPSQKYYPLPKDSHVISAAQGSSPHGGGVLAWLVTPRVSTRVRRIQLRVRRWSLQWPGLPVWFRWRLPSVPEFRNAGLVRYNTRNTG